MHLNMHDVYDEQGAVIDILSEWIQGHKKQIPLLSGLKLSNFHLHTQKDIVFTEKVPRGLYFSFVGSNAIETVEDIQSVQIHYQPQDQIGQFSMKKNEQRGLLQVLISTDYLSLVLGQTEEQVIQHFTNMERKLGNGLPYIQLPFTKSMENLCKSVLDHKGLSISLAGHLYSCLFTLIEQIQMLNHLSECEDCQSKLFKAQNILEVPNNNVFGLEELALAVGLNVDALSIGFKYLVGQSIEDYHKQRRIAFAAEKLRKDPQSKSNIIKQSGFSEEQFETIFTQHFGVNSNQYKQIH
ncbi:helix-turn-helix domain-containing protein [Marinomonas sp. 2405UD68-3]|uniref:helix-turn-helix domain-containing protein n=1 Tax=Marinomonas sp. 2405UD68-3 TaxID=3391835 RepID=UPI0039C9B848